MSEKVYVNICDTKKCPGPVYAVKTGDTLNSNAQRHHCRVRTLHDLNPFVDIYNLQPGEEICVPDCRGQGKVDIRPYVVKEGDTLKIILKNVTKTIEELAKVNRILYKKNVPQGKIIIVHAKKEKIKKNMVKNINNNNNIRNTRNINIGIFIIWTIFRI